MADNFWHDATIEPKRNFRFELRISEDPNLTWLVKTTEKPKLNVSSVPHQYINHTFNYPGRVVWNPVAITLVDVPLYTREAGTSDTTGRVYQFLRKAGYRVPLGDPDTAIDRAATNMEKADAVGALGAIHIRQLGNSIDATTANTKLMPDYVDEWTLHNAFVQGEVNFGTLSYADEELTTISFTLQYDWATFSDRFALGTPRGPGG